MKNFIKHFILALNAMFCINTFCDEQMDATSFMQIAIQNKDYLLSLQVKNGVRDISATEEARQLYPRVQKGEWHNETEGLVIGIFFDSLMKIGTVHNYEGRDYTYPIISDPIIFKLWLAAIEDRDKEFACYALISLADYQLRHDDIDKHIDRIVANATRCNEWTWYYFPETSWEKYAYLKDKFEKAANQKNLEEESRSISAQINALGNLAALGSKEANLSLQKMMADVRVGFYDRTAAIDVVGRLGGRENIIALLYLMNDNTMNDGDTLRKYILNVLFQNYPDETVFLEYILNKNDYNSGKQAYQEKIKKLYIRICGWAKEKINCQLSLDKATLEIFNCQQGIREYPMPPNVE